MDELILGMVVGLSPGEFLLDGDPARPQKGAEPPLKKKFGPCSLLPNGWMDEASTWHGGRPQLRRLCVRWGHSPLPPKGAEPPIQTAACIKMPLGVE